MASTTILNRVRSLTCGAPFYLTPSPEPFDFDRVPQQVIDGAVRVESQTTGTIGGMSFSEERFDTLTIWVGALPGGAPYDAVNSLHTTANSLKAAIIRDGCGVGDFAVLDDAATDVQPVGDSSYYVGRLTVPVSYMVSV